MALLFAAALGSALMMLIAGMESDEGKNSFASGYLPLDPGAEARTGCSGTVRATGSSGFAGAADAAVVPAVLGEPGAAGQLATWRRT